MKKGFKYTFLLSAAAFFGIGLNIFMSLKWISIRKRKVFIDRLPAGLSGVRILQISDLHNASEEKMSLNIWKRIFDEEFDIAVITGDLTVSYYEQILPHKKWIKLLGARVPVFFADGNHERNHFEKMKDFLSGLGITVLDNRKTEILLKGCRLEIMGIRDYYYQEDTNFRYFRKLMKGEAASGFRLLLSHQPQIIDKLKRFKDIFVISGHTHGGQIRIPFLPAIVAPGQGIWPRYGAGFYRVGGNYLYVSSGMGASRIPIRFFNRPEISLLTLMEA